MPLRIHLLGPFQAESDGTPLRLPPRSKVTSLWAYLLLHSEDDLPRTTVAFSLWPDEPEPRARSNLRRDLHRLQSLLPSAPAVHPWLLLGGERLRWNPDAPVWVDTREFDRLSASDSSLGAAVDLYGGDLLEGIYEDWVLGERERYHVRYLAALSRVALLKRESGDLDHAVDYARRLLNLEPLREDLLRFLMTLRYQAGDRAGALQEFDRFVRTLGRELRAEPMPETVALQRAIDANAPLPALPSPPPMVSDEVSGLPSPTPTRLPFVGRAVELAQLTTRWARAARGQGGIVFVSGESGIGKSRLVSEAAFLAERQGGRVLYGTTAPSEPHPYEVVSAVLRRALPYLGDLPLKDVTWSSLGLILPELRSLRPSLPTPAALDPARERQRLFQAVLDVIEALARVRPLMLILEDLHWAGSSTVDLLGFLALHLAGRPVLAVATYREEQVGRAHPLRGLRRDLLRSRLAQQISLRRLALPDVEDLIGHLAVESYDASTLARELFGESEGLPLFLAERLSAVTETSGAGSASWPVELLRREIPRSVEDAILARLDRLPPGAQSVVELASVVGLSLDAELLRELSGWPQRDVADALQVLVDRQILREAGPSGFDFTFDHHLIQEAAYQRMSDAARRRRHARLARVVEELYPQEKSQRAAVLAHHFDLGGETDRAAGYFLLAAQRALSLFADEEGAQLADSGLKRSEDPTVRWGLLGLLETIVARRGDRPRQSEILEEMEAMASRMGPQEACDVLLRQIHRHRALGEREPEARRIEEMEAQAEAAGLTIWTARSLLARALLLTSKGEYESARSLAETARDRFASRADGPGQVESLCALAEVSILQGNVASVPGIVQEALRLATTEANQSLVVHCLRAASAAAFARQEFEASISLGSQMEDLCRRIGDLEGEADALTRLGSARARLFLVDEARRHYAEAARLYRLLGKRQGEGAVFINAGFLLTWLGQYDEARNSYEQADSIFQALDDRRGQVISLLNLGMVELYQGSSAAARDSAARALELARRIESQPMIAAALANLGAAERDLGETRSAIAHMEQGLGLRQTLGQRAEMANDLSDLAVAYLDVGRVTDARVASDEMLGLLAESPSSVMHPQYVLWSAAQTSWAERNEVEARQLLEKAGKALAEKAAAIPDEASRQAFLTLPFNRELTEAVRSGTWPRRRKKKGSA